METVTLAASAVLFDSDGVLVDSHREVEQAWRRLAGEFGLETERLLVELIGVRAVDTLARYLPPSDCAKAVDRLEDLEVELADQTRPMAGAPALLAALSGYRWTIVTSATTRLARARWSGAGIPMPEDPVTADDVSRGKPDPEPYLVGARTVGVDPARCLVFEDSPAGGVAARAAGATVVAVGRLPWSFEPAVRIPDLDGLTVKPGPIDSSGERSLTVSFSRLLA